MKKIWILILFTFSIQTTFSQGNIIETVYLKNGSIIKGMIVEIVPNVSYTVKTADGSVVVCGLADILKITREIAAKNAVVVNQTNKIMSKGYEGIVETGFGAKTGKYGLNLVKLNIINGYRINEKYFVGLGTGLRIFSTDKSTTTMIPIFADFRASFLPKPISPYASFSVGMSFNTASGFKDAGWMFHPEIGIQINKSKDILVHITVGYDVQQLKFLTLDNSDPWNPKLGTVMRFSESGNINLGITF
jgi:hypothetical protein